MPPKSYQMVNAREVFVDARMESISVKEHLMREVVSRLSEVYGGGG